MPTDIPEIKMPALTDEEVNTMLTQAVVKPDTISKGCLAMIVSCVLVLIVAVVLFGLL